MTATLDPDWAPVQCLERQPWGQRWLVQHLGDGRVRECIRIGMAGYDEARLREQLQAYERAADANPALARVERVETRGGEVHLWVEYRAASSLAERLRRGDLPLGRCWEIFSRLAGALDILAKNGLHHGALHPSWVDCSAFAPVLHGAVYALCPGADDLGDAERYRAPDAGMDALIGAGDDQYALALMMAEALFDADIDALKAWATDSSLREMPDVPPEFQPLFKRALSRSPKARWLFCADFVWSLEEAWHASLDGETHAYRWLDQPTPLAPPRVRLDTQAGSSGELVMDGEVFVLPSDGRRLLGLEAWIHGDWEPVALSMFGGGAPSGDACGAVDRFGLGIELGAKAGAVYTPEELGLWRFRRATDRPVLVANRGWPFRSHRHGDPSIKAPVLPPGYKAQRLESTSEGGTRWRVVPMEDDGSEAWCCDRLPRSAFDHPSACDALVRAHAIANDLQVWRGRIWLDADAFYVMSPVPKAMLWSRRQSGDCPWWDLSWGFRKLAQLLDRLASRGLRHGHVQLETVPVEGEGMTGIGYPKLWRSPESSATTAGANTDFEDFVLTCLRFRLGREEHVQTFLAEPERCLLPPCEQAVWRRALSPAAVDDFGSYEAFIDAWWDAVYDTSGGFTAGGDEEVLSLDAYRELFRGLPPPTAEQIDAFVEEAASRHSWYKHLPLDYPGVAFCFYLDPGAGLYWMEDADGGHQPRPLTATEISWHPYGEATDRYRAWYGCLEMTASTVAMISVPPGTPSSRGASARWRSVHLPPAILAAGSVELNAVVHNQTRWPWVWVEELQRRLDEGYAELGGWPKASGGHDVSRAITLLLAISEGSSPTPCPRGFQPPIEILIAPEKQRQREAIRRAIEQVIALTYGE